MGKESKRQLRRDVQSGKQKVGCNTVVLGAAVVPALLCLLRKAVRR
jgi:hypothetical protein